MAPECLGWAAALEVGKPAIDFAVTLLRELPQTKLDYEEQDKESKTTEQSQEPLLDGGEGFDSYMALCPLIHLSGFLSVPKTHFADS